MKCKEGDYLVINKHNERAKILFGEETIPNVPLKVVYSGPKIFHTHSTNKELLRDFYFQFHDENFLIPIEKPHRHPLTAIFK